jgi:hypothetical protein
MLVLLASGHPILALSRPLGSLPHRHNNNQTLSDCLLPVAKEVPE